MAKAKDVRGGFAPAWVVMTCLPISIVFHLFLGGLETADPRIHRTLSRWHQKTPYWLGRKDRIERMIPEPTNKPSFDQSGQ